MDVIVFAVIPRASIQNKQNSYWQGKSTHNLQWNPDFFYTSLLHIFRPNPYQQIVSEILPRKEADFTEVK